MMINQIPEHLHAISRRMKGFQSKKCKFWKLLKLPTNKLYGEAIQVYMAYSMIFKKLVPDQNTFNRLAAQPKAPIVTQFLAHASNAEARPKYAE